MHLSATSRHSAANAFTQSPALAAKLPFLKLFRVISLLVLVSGAGYLQNAKPLGDDDKLNYGLDVHFFHDHLPMRLDRALGAAKFARGMLVCFTPHDDLEDLPLARGQR